MSHEEWNSDEYIALSINSCYKNNSFAQVGNLVAKIQGTDYTDTWGCAQNGSYTRMHNLEEVYEIFRMCRYALSMVLGIVLHVILGYR